MKRTERAATMPYESRVEYNIGGSSVMLPGPD